MDAQKLFSHVSVFITTARDYRTLGTGVLTADCTDEYPIKPPVKEDTGFEKSAQDRR
jgi:hypothetical protein